MGELGSYQLHHNVYDRLGEPCIRCGTRGFTSALWGSCCLLLRGLPALSTAAERPELGEFRRLNGPRAGIPGTHLPPVA